ncbi:MAG: hypothetical protein J6W96_05985, partial [Alphaproteobacteria bacterium]|nr:hypothetical protein [Alphaproteobacteria bacterium]
MFKLFGETKDVAFYQFFDRIDKFFKGGSGNARFASVIDSLINAYSLIMNRWHTDHDTISRFHGKADYSKLLEAVVDLFAELSGSLFNDDMYRLFASIEKPYGDTTAYELFFDRIDNFFKDSDKSGGNDRFTSIIDSLIAAYKTIEEKYSEISPYLNRKFDIMGAFEIFDIFSSEGLGSEEWLDNYEAFARKVKSTGFITEYVGLVDKIFEAFKKSSMYNPETGEISNM